MGDYSSALLLEARNVERTIVMQSEINRFAHRWEGFGYEANSLGTDARRQFLDVTSDKLHFIRITLSYIMIQLQHYRKWVCVYTLSH